jgi:hypothetical protein
VDPTSIIAMTGLLLLGAILMTECLFGGDDDQEE